MIRAGRVALALLAAAAANAVQAQSSTVPPAAPAGVAARPLPNWQQPAGTPTEAPGASAPSGAVTAPRRAGPPQLTGPSPRSPAAVAVGDAVPATTAALAAQCAQLGTDAPLILSVNGRAGRDLWQTTVSSNQRFVIHGCNLGERAGVWLVPVYDGSAVATSIVRKFGAPQTDNVFVGELAGPLQPIEGRPGRFVLVLMPILPNSNLFDARAATACCFSPSAGGSP